VVLLRYFELRKTCLNAHFVIQSEISLIILKIMEELSKKKLERQDFVDNEVFDLIKKLISANKAKNLQWDIEMIGEVRDVIRIYAVDRKKLMTEQEFYPHVEIIDGLCKL